jgi:transketolase
MAALCAPRYTCRSLPGGPVNLDLHRTCVNTIKGLAMDAVQAAKSGHPGMPMGAADMATVLWGQYLKHDPVAPDWPDRDRFILSAGHGSMLLYALLHLSGYDLSLQDIKDFRQWGSKTPGHPEVGHTPGVETTTGPLGQGFATGVGMAMAERALRERFGTSLCDHHIYGIVSDGDLMEGISQEAASLAGHLELGRLIYLYDDNEISIDGSTDISFTEDVVGRMTANGWHAVRVDGHDPKAIAGAIDAARQDPRPSIIACRTVIGQGSPAKQGSSSCHGAPLGPEEVAATKRNIGLDPDAQFAVADGAISHLRDHSGAEARAAWEGRLADHPERAEFEAWLEGSASALFERVEWPEFETGKKLATRKASAAVLRALSAAAPWLVGGSADLAGSNGVAIGATTFKRGSFAGAQSVHFGVREHAMAAACNGMALHGGFRPYCATFLAFHDYHRPSVRLSALMEQPVIYLYSHDSVFLGEDGPTHQPVATLLALRSLPGVDVFRPSDATETAEAWRQALSRTDGPTAIILTRQGVPTWEPEGVAEGTAKGGYVLQDADSPEVCLIGTGSEVATCVDAAAALAGKGIRARVVSMPCRERFLTNDRAYRDSVLTPGIPRVSVEAGVTLGWSRWVGEHGAMIGIDRYGVSAPAGVIAEQFGFTGAAIAARAVTLLRSEA